MPDEDMEMGVDFAHAGLVEDIDIDLDFPIGQLDADMILEDFDRDLNSDTRDELMIEGDDLHYGMVDAIEIDHNASAAAANDIDIDLGHEVESIWQETLPPGDDNPTAEIDYLDEAGVEQMEDEEGDIRTGSWLQPVGSQDTDAMGDPNSTSAGLSLGPLEAHEDFPPEALAAAHSESSGHSEGSQSDAEGRHTAAIADAKEGTQLSVSEDPAQEGQFTASTYERAEEPPNTEKGESQVDHSDGDAIAKNSGLNPEEEEPSRLKEAGNPAEEVDPVPTDESHLPRASNRLGESEGVAVTNVDEDEDGDEDENEDENEYNDQADPSQPDGVDQSADHVDASEDQLGGESYVKATDDQAQTHDASDTELTELDQSYPQSVGSTSGEVVEEEASDRRGSVVNTATPSVGAGNRDDPIKLANHYGVYISYGSTDYNLFAKDENDDPNDYFLSDKSALDFSLMQFLSSLREVISEEVSPLDELVMHVDGLGLEFSESTAPDFLGKFTFGDLVVLYDKLVQNEEAELSPPIYTFLTVRPNCNQRMRALTESANAGRGLSEVALYRDPSTVEEDRASNADSPDTDLSVGDDYEDNNEDQLNVQEGLSEVDSGSGGAEHSLSPVTGGVQLEPSEQNVELDEFEKESNRDGDGDDGGDDDDDSRHLDSVDTLRDGEEISTSDHDQATNETSTTLPRGSTHTLEAHTEAFETGDSEVQALTGHSSLDVPKSHTTSATATLDGEDEDEIDYNSDDDNEDSHDATDGAILHGEPSTTTADVKVSVDDEITWESDNEEKEDQTESASPKDTVQVSPVSRKRAQSEALGDTDDENDNKRRRS